MTIREIITKLETENSLLSSENIRLKRELEELSTRLFSTERELKSLTKCVITPEVIEATVIEPEVLNPEVIEDEPVKKKSRKKKISE